jgi:predicted double-glycine peptidase
MLMISNRLKGFSSWMLKALATFSIFWNWGDWVSSRANADPPMVGIQELKNQLKKQQANENTCGVDSLFLLMQLSGHRCSISRIKELVPIEAQGSSLVAMQAASRELGFPLEIMFYRPDQISKLELPAIVLLEPAGSDINHFVLLLETTDEKVVVLDPNYNEIRHLNRQDFARLCTGYYLARKSPMFPAWLTVAWLFVGSIILIDWFIRGASPRRQGEKRCLTVAKI